jgi:hypothetical protein
VPYYTWGKLQGPEKQQQYLVKLFEDAGVLRPDQPASPKLPQQQQQQQQQPQQQQQQQQRSALQEKGSKAKATARALLQRSGLQPRGTSTEAALVGAPGVRQGSSPKGAGTGCGSLVQFQNELLCSTVASDMTSQPMIFWTSAGYGQVLVIVRLCLLCE